MPKFRYKARDDEGELVTGEIEAISGTELKESLFREGMIPINVVEIKKGEVSFKSVSNYIKRVKTDDILIFTRQFYTLFKAGVSMDTILGTMIKQSRSASLKNALVRIRADISSGSTISQAFGRHPNIFNELYVSMLSAGEEAGILEEVLRQLSDLLSRDYEIQKSVKGATLYPKIVVTVLVLAVTFLMAFVVPKFVNFYGRYGTDLPLPTQILIGMSSFVRNYWFVVCAVVGGLFYLYRRFYSTNVGRMRVDKIRFRLPVFGQLNMKVANARFGRILSSLYHSGLSLPRSLEVVANVIGNHAFAMEVRKVKDDIQKGSTLAEALERQTYFPPVIVETASIGESAGALDEMLSTVADHFDMEVSHMIKNLMTLLEPLLLVGIFGFVTLLALAIYLPIWNLSAVVGK